MRHGGKDQMTVGEILQLLHAYPEQFETRWSFHGPHSYRGYYDQVAVSVRDDGQTVAEMRRTVADCLDTFTGWKGGEFTMDADTPVWVAEPGLTGIPLVRQFLFLAIDG